MVVASSKECQNEIVLVRPNILSMQSHPDLTPHLMMSKIWPAIVRKGFVEPGNETGARKQMERLDTKICLDFIREFLSSSSKLY